jgi:hypothetical protein
LDPVATEPLTKLIDLYNVTAQHEGCDSLKIVHAQQGVLEESQHSSTGRGNVRYKGQDFGSIDGDSSAGTEALTAAFLNRLDFIGGGSSVWESFTGFEQHRSPVIAAGEKNRSRRRNALKSYLMPTDATSIAASGAWISLALLLKREKEGLRGSDRGGSRGWKGSGAHRSLLISGHGWWRSYFFVPTSLLRLPPPINRQRALCRVCAAGSAQHSSRGSAVANSTDGNQERQNHLSIAARGLLEWHTQYAQWPSAAVAAEAAKAAVAANIRGAAPAGAYAPEYSYSRSGYGDCDGGGGNNMSNSFCEESIALIRAVLDQGSATSPDNRDERGAQHFEFSCLPGMASATTATTTGPTSIVGAPNTSKLLSSLGHPPSALAETIARFDAEDHCEHLHQQKLVASQVCLLPLHVGSPSKLASGPAWLGASADLF